MLHPTMTNEELLFITDAIRQTICNIDDWEKDYSYDISTNEFIHRDEHLLKSQGPAKWFCVD